MTTTRTETDRTGIMQQWEAACANEERRAIDACDHTRATVEDRDEATDREGKTIGVREFIDCPDCPLSDWFDVTDRERN